MSRPVLFDLFHTLVDGTDHERNRIVGEMGVIVGVDPDALVAAYQATWRERMTEWNVEHTIEVLARRLGGNPTEDQISRAATLRRTHACAVLSNVRASTLATLDALRADGHPLALVSNATAEAGEAWPQTPLASRFDVAVFSCAAGLAKPNPAIYLSAAAQLGVDGATCVFVGDGADGELAGAVAAGMTVYRTTEFANSDPSWRGLTIASLAELPGRLREAYPRQRSVSQVANLSQ